MSIQTTIFGLGLCLAAVGGFAVFAISGSAKGVSILKPDNPEIVAEGSKVYSENCASCHGENLEGQPNWKRPGPDGFAPAPPHDETGHTWHHTDDILFGVTKFGTAKLLKLENFKSVMPVFENTLSDAEIIAALSYIKAQWPADIRENHDTMNAEKQPE